MLTEEIKDFFKNIAPFSLLDDSEIDIVLMDIGMEYYPKGEKILWQDGPPSEHLGVIKKGGLKISVTSDNGEEIIIDYRSDGELFGMLSAVSGDRSRANVVTIEDTICYMIAKERILDIFRRNPAASEYFLKSFFLNFIDKSHAETKKKYSTSAENDNLLFITPIKNLVRREPITVPPHKTIRDSARLMAANNISSLIVTTVDNTPIGVITDRDLREKVVAADMSTDQPISKIMSSTLRKIEGSENCFNGLLRMIRHKIHHILVVENGKLVGMITNHDLMVLQGFSPTMLVKEINGAESLEQLKNAIPKFYRTVAGLIREGAAADDVTDFISEVAEKIINRIIDMFEAQTGKPPINYSLFLYSAGGRRELTLDCEIRLGIIIEENKSISNEIIDSYFYKLSKMTNEFLFSCLSCDIGFSQKQIKTFEEWKKIFNNLDSTSDTISLSEFLDMRPIRGNKDRVVEIRNLLHDSISSKKNIMHNLAEDIVANSPPLGFFKKFVVEKGGEHQNEFNLYSQGIKPFVNIGTFFTLNRCSREHSTISRFKKLSSSHFPRIEDATHALNYLFTLLLHQQLLQIENQKTPDCFINPGNLLELEKKTLKESFQLIVTLFDKIKKEYGLK